MLKHKSPSQKGKISLTRFFQKFKAGDAVAVVRELGVNLSYSKRIQGKTGKVLGQRGKAYEIEVKDMNKPKRYLIKPIHLKKIEQIK